MNKAPVNIWVQTFFVTHILISKYLGVELLDHGAGECLTLAETAKLCLKLAVGRSDGATLCTVM